MQSHFNTLSSGNSNEPPCLIFFIFLEMIGGSEDHQDCRFDIKLTNNDKINSIIMRTDKEKKFFSDLDIQQEHELPVAMAWKAAGNWGKPPQLRLGFGYVVIRLALY